MPQQTNSTNNLPLVSVVIPAYNSEPFVSLAIRSVVEQIWSAIEIVVVDDGSTDRTYDVAAEFHDTRIPIHVHRKENGGASSARNFGFARISPHAKYILFLDADDQLRPEALKKMVGYMEEHLDVGLLGCQFNYIDYDSDQIIPTRRTRYCRPGLLPRDLRDDEYETPFEVFYCATGQGPYALYRRSIYERTCGWSEDFWGHNDTDMFIQMALEAPVHYLPDVLYLKKKVRNSLEHLPNRGQLYGKLRRKWDSFETTDPRKSALLASARAYYRSWHRPCRDLKVGMKKFRELLRRPNRDRAKCCLSLFCSGLGQFLWSRITTTEKTK